MEMDIEQLRCGFCPIIFVDLPAGSAFGLGDAGALTKVFIHPLRCDDVASTRFMTDYDVLGVPRNATPDQVKAAYRRLCLRHHPDLFPTEERLQAEAQFRTVLEAYNRLQGKPGARPRVSDPDRPRRTYQWGATHIPKRRFSNGMVATAICVPLALAGIWMAATSENTPESMGRPHGLLNPPVNPFLADAYKPRQHRSNLFRGSSGEQG